MLNTFFYGLIVSKQSVCDPCFIEIQGLNEQKKVGVYLDFQQFVGYTRFNGVQKVKIDQ
jgi:hypothetical protein